MWYFLVIICFTGSEWKSGRQIQSISDQQKEAWSQFELKIYFHFC